MIKKFTVCLLAFGVYYSVTLAQQVNMPNFSASALEGKELFQQHCIQCHGETALGTALGPPLLHPFYRPGHHDDDALKRAIKKGVVAHHWQFGPMPAMQAVSDADIPKLVTFIRELQRANGIK